MRKKKKSDPVDDAINTAWNQRASGVQVNIMDITKIFAECRAAMASGTKVEDAVDACIAKYRQN